MGVPPINPPYIFDPDPPDEESGVARDKVLTWSILDPDGDLSWWKIWIDEGEGEQLVVDSTEEEPGPYSPYDGGSSAVVPVFGDPDDGVSVTIEKTSDWPSLTEITVHVEAEDDLANSLDTSWSFTIEEYETEVAPVLQNQNPAPSSTGNRGDGPIYLEVYDANGDLKASTVEIWVNRVLAWSGSSAASGWTGTRGTIVDGHSYTLTSDVPLPAGSTVTVRVYAEDDLGLVLDEAYAFDVGIFLDGVELGGEFGGGPGIDAGAGGVISTVGGERVVARGLWPVDQTVEVHLGPLGTVEDPLCYGGQGLGYEALSLDGVTLEVASPPLTKGYVALTVVYGATVLSYGDLP